MQNRTKKHNNSLKDNNVFVDQKQMQQSQKTVRWQPDGSNAKGYIPLIFQSLSEKKLKMWKWYLLGIQNKSIRKTSRQNLLSEFISWFQECVETSEIQDLIFNTLFHSSSVASFHFQIKSYLRISNQTEVFFSEIMAELCGFVFVIQKRTSKNIRNFVLYHATLLLLFSIVCF